MLLSIAVQILEMMSLENIVLKSPLIMVIEFWLVWLIEGSSLLGPYRFTAVSGLSLIKALITTNLSCGSYIKLLWVTFYGSEWKHLFDYYCMLTNRPDCFVGLLGFIVLNWLKRLLPFLHFTQHFEKTWTATTPPPSSVPPIDCIKEMDITSVTSGGEVAMVTRAGSRGHWSINLSIRT